MRMARLCGHDVLNMHATHEQGVSNQRAMTAPRYCFGAHDRRAFGARQLEQAFDALPEFVASHIVGVTPEGIVAPAGIDRIPLWVTETSEGFQVRVVNAPRG